MIDNQTMTFLKGLPGGEWGSEEKKQKLYSLVMQCAKEFPDTTLLSVELGIFGGGGLFPLGMAHKELNNGFAIGLDSWNNTDPLEGTNSEENAKWWGSLDQKDIYGIFRLATTYHKWNGFAEHLVGRTDEFMDKFQDDTVTLLHQDSNHASEVIIRELELWAPKMKIGGYWIVDDCDWESTKEGYAKLPSFGFELVERFETWAIYKKVENATAEEINRVVKTEFPEYSHIPVPVAEDFAIKETTIANHYEPEPLSIIDLLKHISWQNEEVIRIHPHQPKIWLGNGTPILPILLYLPDTPEWVQRFKDGLAHFKEQGFTPYCFPGIHSVKFGIQGTRKYMRDAWTRIRAKYTGQKLPEVMPVELKEQFKIGDGFYGAYLSHYMMYNIMMALPFEYFMVLEDDCRFLEGWKEKLQQALKDVPSDFDFLFVGSSDAENKEPIRVGESDVYHFPNREGKPDYFPQTGHAYIVSKRALPIMIATQRDTADPIDISLIYETFPLLNVYVVLPRLAIQENTKLNP